MSDHTPQGGLRIGYVVGVSMADAVAVVGLVLLFLRAHGESAQHVLFGKRPALGEALLGIPLAIVALLLAAAVLTTIQQIAPGLHTVEHNPLQPLMKSPRNAGLFVLVALVAGGLREEVQRAFLLHRFEVWLGGDVMGLVVTSVAFGAGHFIQGGDAVIATAALGAFWGMMYLRRRSMIAPLVSHSGFDLAQIIAQALIP